MSYHYHNHNSIIILIPMIIVFISAISGFSGEMGPYEVSTSCTDCHEEMSTNLSGTTHATAKSRTGSGVFCVDCHRGWEIHIEDPSAENITDPSSLDPYSEFDVCNKCHFGNSELDFAHGGKHFQEGINCSGCHVIHSSADHPGQLRKGDVYSTCNECHTLEMTSFSQIASHPVKSGGISCIDCHDYFSAVNNHSTSDSENQLCYNCHPEMEGPFMHEHEATRDYGLEDGGCLNCHDAHGSPFEYLLKEPTVQICRQCHVIPGHSTAHSGVFAGRDCLDCHIDIHGSNSNAYYFSGWVLGSGCTNCHN